MTAAPTPPAAPGVRAETAAQPAVRLGRAQRWLGAGLLLFGVGAATMVTRDAVREGEPALRLDVAGWGTRVTAPGPTALAAAPRPASDEPYFPFLAGESATASVSVGDSSNGFVVNARALQEDETLAILPSHRARQLRHGTVELLALLRDAAADLHRKGGTRLWVGNIGRPGGGDVSYSVSHNSGRDADLAICYRNAAGKPVDPPDLVPLNSSGLSKDGRLWFDAERTWVMVRALLESKAAEVQYLFFSNSLRKLMLQHATAKGEPARLLERAAAVVVQPAGAAHNDHLHLRVYCSERDVLGGCLDSGVVHPWAKSHLAAKRAWTEQVRRTLDDESPTERRRALERLVLLVDRAAVPAIGLRLGDADPTVRRAAAQALGSLGSAGDAALVAGRFGEEEDFAVRVSLVEALGSMGGAEAARFLGELVRSSAPPWLAALDRLAEGVGRWRDPSGSPVLVAATALRAAAALPAMVLRAQAGTDWRPGEPAPPEGAPQRLALRLVAIDAAGDLAELELVDVLLATLADPSPIVRGRGAAALGRLSNTVVGTEWAKPDQAAALRARHIATWRRWIERNRGRPRDGWLAAGFTGAGYRIPEIHPRHLWELVRAASGPDHLRYNAERVLERLTDHHPPPTDRSAHDTCAYWLRWLRNRRARFELDAPPAELVRRCS